MRMRLEYDQKEEMRMKKEHEAVCRRIEEISRRRMSDGGPMRRLNEEQTSKIMEGARKNIQDLNVHWDDDIKNYSTYWPMERLVSFLI